MKNENMRSHQINIQVNTLLIYISRRYFLTNFTITNIIILETFLHFGNVLTLGSTIAITLLNIYDHLVGGGDNFRQSVI